MFGIVKKFVRVGVIGTLVVGTAAGAAVLIAGPNRAKAVASQLHGQVLDSIDEHIDDPAALRAQLQEMEREYPKRIAQVRGDLAELQEQIRQLEREKEIATRVVALADNDLQELEAKLSHATAEVEAGSARLAAVTFDDRVYSYERAAARARQIRGTRTAYAGRAEDADHDLEYLTKQALRMEELLTQLETERAEFRAQIVALSRQVDAIARNERLIGLMEQRNRTIESCSRYEAVSLDQLTGRLAEIRSRQEAELSMLASAQEQADYEELARIQISREATSLEERASDPRVLQPTGYATALNGTE